MNRGERNPYPVYGLNAKEVGWRWKDENGVMYPCLYASESDALHAMLRHINKLPLWTRWVTKLKRAWKAHA